MRVTTVRWVIPAVVRDSSASRTTPWSSQLPKASTTGAPGAVKSSAPRPLNPLARTRSTGPASSAWPDPLSNRTTWVTSGDSSGEQAYSLLAGAVKTDSGTRWARPSPGTETGAGETSTRASPPSSTPGRPSTGAGPMSPIASSRNSTSTVRRSAGVRSPSVSRSSPSRGGSLASADRAVDNVSRTPDQSSPVRCQTIASVSSVRASPSSTAR